MQDSENLYDKIEEMFGKNPGNLNILDHEIDVETQLEYFEISRKMASEYDEHWAISLFGQLQKRDYPLEMKKRILARLATIDRVECYRMIESFVPQAEEDLRDWVQLSLYESRMHLEGEFLGENQIFISTGLGGKNNKLRYFVVLIARNMVDLNGTQKRIIRNEFDFILKKYDVEIEKVEFSNYLATVILLLPIQFPVKQVVDEAIGECNLYGGFLRDSFIVTNVKTLTFNEIKHFIERKQT